MVIFHSFLLVYQRVTLLEDSSLTFDAFSSDRLLRSQGIFGLRQQLLFVLLLRHVQNHEIIGRWYDYPLVMSK